MPEKRLRDISFVGVKFAEHLVSQRINDVLVAVVHVGTGQDKVNQLSLLVAEQMQLEADIPAHRALTLGRDILEHLHAELALVVDYRDAGAVDKTDSCALSETCQPKEHCQSHETAWHDLHEAVVGECAGKQMLPVNAYTPQIIMLEVAVGVEVKADQDCDDLGIGHHAFSAPFLGLGRR